MRTLLRRPLVFLGLLLVGVTTSQALATLSPQTRDSVSIRGQQQTVSIYGRRGGQPIVVTSGDGGWIHLGPVVAEYLASQGFFVVGFDARAYLESFTSTHSTLLPGDVPVDFGALVGFAAAGARQRPILAGVSEGAGLSVLAAADPAIKPRIEGVLCLGLPDINELGWRWKDDVIYVTHGVPNEPTFSAAAVIAKVAPLPLAEVHSNRDEYVPVADVQRVMGAAGEPKRMWVVDASDHRFSSNLHDCDRRLLEAIDWIHLSTSLKASQAR